MSRRPGDDVRTDRGRSLFRAVLDDLTAAGVVYCLRNGADGLSPARGADVDVLISPSARSRASRTLRASGWHRLRAPGHWDHDFWLRREQGGRWLKIDMLWRLRYDDEAGPTEPWLDRRVCDDGVWVASAGDVDLHRQHRAAGRRERPGGVERAARRLPPGPRRTGPVVAVLGPDGAGKGTVIAELCEEIPVAVTTRYLGSTRRAPSRESRRDREGSPRHDQGAASRPTVRLREIAFLGRKWLRTWPALVGAYAAAWRGHVVLLDRHPLDALAVRPDRSRWGARLEVLLSARLTPRPDAVVVLDAPGDVLFARKQEHSPDVLERWRRGYRHLPGRHVHVLDATAPLEQVAALAGEVVWRELARRRGWVERGES